MAKNNTYCCVPQCNNFAREGLSFHLFPKDPKKKAAWEMALKMGKPASVHMRVCSEHFSPLDYFPGEKKRQLKNNTIPSQKLPVRSHDRTQNEEAKKSRAERTLRRSAVGNVQSSSSKEAEKCEGINNAETEAIDVEKGHSNESNETEPPSKDASVQCSCSVLDKSTFVDPECLKLTSPPLQKECTLLQILTDRHILYTYTGLHSFELLDGIVQCVSDLELPKQQPKQLCLKERVVLTFVKLKLNLYFTTMAPLFGISRFTCSKYFQDMITKLRKVMDAVIEFPDVEANRNNMPLCFSKYKATRVVIDCAETPVECCKCIKCRILTYSHYKKRNTLKFLVGVAPSGMIIFISESYGGRASDKQVTKESGILDKIEFMGAVMADKGFNVKQECYERNITLYQPPFLTRKRKQFSKEEALRTARIAKARVHVERAIQRLREFQFLTKEVEWQLVPNFDDALVVAAGVVNLSAPILNVDKF